MLFGSSHEKNVAKLDLAKLSGSGHEATSFRGMKPSYLDAYKNIIKFKNK